VLACEIEVERVSVPPPFAIRPLPAVATRLLVSQSAPPRLIAHLALVPDAAGELVEHVASVWPSLTFDAEEDWLVALADAVGKGERPRELGSFSAVYRTCLNKFGLIPTNRAPIFYCMST
jgi:hypothetical protein